MLYWLFTSWQHYFSPFRVFRYITFRTAYASLTALLIALLLGPWLIRRLREYQIGQQIRDDGPQSHLAKAGTPTMGGILVVVSIVLPTLLWGDLRNRFIWMAVFATLAFGTIGLFDDLAKVAKKKSLGLTGRQKLIFQTLTALVIAGLLIHLAHEKLYSTNLIVPFFKQFNPDLTVHAWMKTWWMSPLAYIPFAAFVAIVIVGSSNAVNLTDGLDGLAIGSVLIAATALTVLTYVSGHAKFAEYLDIQNLPRVGEVTVFCGAMVGASLGFLWYNCFPAAVFMGDVGSLALGGAIGTVGVIIKQEILLLSIGGIFVIEALSVMIQVLSFKLTGKRVFRMAPIHHHFELIGWKEPQVIIRFWIAALIFALFSLTTLKLR
ncbi:MAG: phospho-N-acetylmuramoyl-pentapeptide-transferase [Acidobacteriia bacterium]|nr:phospho-N-acetylmuramoyl-pentapeptide-transferase [Terriglobia bacterium]